MLFDILDDWFHEPTFRGCLFISAAVQFPEPNDPIHHAAARHGHSLYAVIHAMAQEAGAEHPDALAKQMLMLIAGALVARHVDLDLTAAATARAMGAMLMEHHMGAARTP